MAHCRLCRWSEIITANKVCNGFLPSSLSVCLSGLLIVAACMSESQCMVSMSVCVCACMNVYVFMHVCMYVCMRWMRQEPGYGEDSVFKSHKDRGRQGRQGPWASLWSSMKKGLTEAGHSVVYYCTLVEIVLEVLCAQLLLFVCIR